MTYQTVATYSQTAALLLFMALFLGVVVYTFWPGNKKRFDDAAHSVLDTDLEHGHKGEGS